jgi:hypothetical protein
MRGAETTTVCARVEEMNVCKSKKGVWQGEMSVCARAERKNVCGGQKEQLLGRVQKERCLR